MRPPKESRNSRTGSASAPAKKEETEGPLARTMTLLGWVPVMINPPMRALSPVSTRRRVEMLPSTVAVQEGVGVEVKAGVAVGAGVGVPLETVTVPTIPQQPPCGVQ